VQEECRPDGKRQIIVLKRLANKKFCDSGRVLSVFSLKTTKNKDVGPILKIAHQFP
jgi:hypothetical protein